MRQQVERLLGMTFDAFCRSVLLAQNRFAEFLKATPTDRNAVLKGVFGYERFDAALAAAKDRVRGADLELEALAREGSRLDEARSRLDEARAEAETTSARHANLDAARERLDVLTQHATSRSGKRPRLGPGRRSCKRRPQRSHRRSDSSRLPTTRRRPTTRSGSPKRR